MAGRVGGVRRVYLPEPQEHLLRLRGQVVQSRNGGVEADDAGFPPVVDQPSGGLQQLHVVGQLRDLLRIGAKGERLQRVVPGGGGRLAGGGGGGGSRGFGLLRRLISVQQVVQAHQQDRGRGDQDQQHPDPTLPGIPPVADPDPPVLLLVPQGDRVLIDPGGPAGVGALPGGHFPGSGAAALGEFGLGGLVRRNTGAADRAGRAARVVQLPADVTDAGLQLGGFLRVQGNRAGRYHRLGHRRGGGPRDGFAPRVLVGAAEVLVRQGGIV